MAARCELGDRVIDNIRYLRNVRNLSQKELERRAGVKNNYINNIELYKFYPSFSHLENIAKALNVKPHQLLEEIY